MNLRQVYHYARWIFMKTKSLVLFLCLLYAREGRCESPNEELPAEFGLIEPASRVRELPVDLPEESDDFFYRFASKSKDRLSLRLHDAINPMQVWDRELSPTNSPIVRINFVTSSMKYAIREMAVDTYLVENMRGWFRDFVRGAFGNTEEEDVSIVDRPSLQYSEETWRQEIKRHDLKWGIRLLRWPDPYAYVSGRLGRHDGQEIFLWHLRYYFREFEEHKIEALFSMILPYNSSLSTGIVFSAEKRYREIGSMYFGTVSIDKWFSKRWGGFTTRLGVSKDVLVTGAYFIAF